MRKNNVITLTYKKMQKMNMKFIILHTRFTKLKNNSKKR